MMIELPRVLSLSTKLDLPTIAMSFSPRDKVVVTVIWRAFRVDMDTQQVFYSIDMNSVRGLMPCKVTGGLPVDYETFKRKVSSRGSK